MSSEYLGKWMTGGAKRNGVIAAGGLNAVQWKGRLVLAAPTDN